MRDFRPLRGHLVRGQRLLSESMPYPFASAYPAALRLTQFLPQFELQLGICGFETQPHELFRSNLGSFLGIVNNNNFRENQTRLCLGKAFVQFVEPLNELRGPAPRSCFGRSY